MKVSTKARYGLRLMMALATRHGQGPVFLKDIAREQELSEKYLSRIVIDLRSAGLLDAFRGANGGYILTRSPDKITVREVVTVLEDMTPVECAKEPAVCGRVEICSANEVWCRLDKAIQETLGGITLEDMLAWGRQKNENYVMYYL
ncbi:MAG: Rrf2 family transcriptional regulator [Planctomycetes bacterium]|nr:Rrf2 family transcriptional regulator [Planctomycetota bacterium]